MKLRQTQRILFYIAYSETDKGSRTPHPSSKGRLKMLISPFSHFQTTLFIVRIMIRLDIRNNGAEHRFKGNGVLFCLRLAALNESAEMTGT